MAAPTPAETMAKIRSHKFGRRKLATDSAWCAYNKIAKNADGKRTAVLQRIASDATVHNLVLAMNTSLSTMLRLIDPTGDYGNAIIKLDTVTNGEMFIPRSVWYGYLDFPTGTLSDNDRTTFQVTEKAFADDAGKLRARIAQLIALEGLTNDLANANAKPNKGGEVGAKA